MRLIDIASSEFVWRGMEYYKQNKVLSYTVNKDGTCEGIVEFVKKKYMKWRRILRIEFFFCYFIN